MKRKRERRGETWRRISIDDHPKLYVRQLPFYDAPPFSLWITFSSRIVDHVRSKCSLKQIIYTSGRNARVEQTIKETKRRDESDLLLSNVALRFSLTKRPDPSDIAQFFILAKYSPEIYLIFIAALSIFFYRPSAFPRWKMFLSWKEILVKWNEFPRRTND